MSTIRNVKGILARKPDKKQRRRHSLMAFEMIRLDRTSEEPLHEQLYRQIRDELVSATFNNNSSRLPSSRELAVDLRVSRFTVNVAFSRLHSEGYLQSKIGSGTFVAEPLPETFLSARNAKVEPHIERPCRLSDRVKNIPDHSISESPAHRASRSFPLSQHLTNFQSKYGNDSEQKCWQKREPTYSSMLQVVATPTCAKRSQLICVITEVRAVIQTRSSSLPERSRQ